MLSFYGTPVIAAAPGSLLISLSQKSLFHTGWGLHSSDKPGIAPQVEKKKKKKDAKSQERARLSCCVHKLHWMFQKIMSGMWREAVPSL